jgi:hypothetical protein
MDLIRGKKAGGGDSDSTSHLQDAVDDFDSTSVEDLKLETITPAGSPTPYILVKEFPAWIDNKGSNPVFDTTNFHRLQSAQHHDGRTGHINHHNYNLSNGDVIKPFGDHCLDNGSLQAQNPKHLMNQLGLLNYHKPGE